MGGVTSRFFSTSCGMLRGAVACAAGAGLALLCVCALTCGQEAAEEGGFKSLPAPVLDGQMSLEKALAQRRSVRSFLPEGLTEAQRSQILWAAQGRNRPAERFGRTAPSAGALYPLEIYAVSASGVYRYDPEGHRIERTLGGDRRADLAEAALRQGALRTAPEIFVIAAVYGRVEAKYGPERTPRYVHIEVGHAAQNILLQAVALGLGAVPIGAFHDDKVKKALSLPGDHEPLYLIPAGKPAPK